jgi:hypothetical protein
MHIQIWGNIEDRASSSTNQCLNWAHENLCTNRKIHWNLSHGACPSKLDHGKMEIEGTPSVLRMKTHNGSKL